MYWCIVCLLLCLNIDQRVSINSPPTYQIKRQLTFWSSISPLLCAMYELVIACRMRSSRLHVILRKINLVRGKFDKTSRHAHWSMLNTNIYIYIHTISSYNDSEENVVISSVGRARLLRPERSTVHIRIHYIRSSVIETTRRAHGSQNTFNRIGWIGRRVTR